MMNKIKDNQMILAEGQYYDLDCYKTLLNNNVLVVGTSGSGKTRSIVAPNILQAYGSYLIVDPKGNLYEQYSEYLTHKGYIVKKLNFADPSDNESARYNPFHYIHSEQDILKIADIIVRGSGTHRRGVVNDTFWEDSSVMLMTALIGLLHFHSPEEERTLSNLLKYIRLCQVNEEYGTSKVALDYVFDDVAKVDMDSFAYRYYKTVRQSSGKTLLNILISLSSTFGCYDTNEIRDFTADDTVNIGEIGERKTALFVIVSDTDRSMDKLVNVFFTQAMSELCRQADCRPDNRLPVDVRFILDDFATNVTIAGFPRMVSSIRSRGISTMLMIQAESQLRNGYGEDWTTIIGNCDTYVYLGGNDLSTAENVAKRANIPLMQVLNMPVGSNWIFRRGQVPVHSTNFKLEPFRSAKYKSIEPEREM